MLWEEEDGSGLILMGSGPGVLGHLPLLLAVTHCSPPWTYKSLLQLFLLRDVLLCSVYCNVLTNVLMFEYCQYNSILFYSILKPVRSQQLLIINIWTVYHQVTTHDHPNIIISIKHNLIIWSKSYNHWFAKNKFSWKF